MVAEIIKLCNGIAIKAVTREQYVESVLSLGRPRGLEMGALEMTRLARASVWRQIARIADESPEGWDAAEGEWVPDVSGITDAGVLRDLSELAAVAVALDLTVAELEDIEMRNARRSPR